MYIIDGYTLSYNGYNSMYLRCWFKLGRYDYIFFF